ncbi:hypothetical protein [Asanoa iriomotensis]|uniref:Uncharacterized protein n=1 Tax=Asanoa iriomotensis TaxID=234613 RepID=A0ABQ4BXL2_9ACTN|nr:hypothetical protein [Asanoa iriomotensis]GIF55276.1 hypothetical protein Air01nite_13710 [Asanoa iriomotensis]
MGYSVWPSGRLLLPAADEDAAVRAAKAAFATREGWFTAELFEPCDALADIAWVGTAAATRHGDWVEFGRNHEHDSKWSEQATAFWVAIAPYVCSGTVHFSGEDGAEWSYSYADGRITQEGWNAWDGSVEPFGEYTEPGSVSP